MTKDERDDGLDDQLDNYSMDDKRWMDLFSCRFGRGKKKKKKKSVILCQFLSFSFICKKWMLPVNRADEYKHGEGLFHVVITFFGHRLKSFVSHVV